MSAGNYQFSAGSGQRRSVGSTPTRAPLLGSNSNSRTVRKNPMLIMSESGETPAQRRIDHDLDIITRITDVGEKESARHNSSQQTPELSSSSRYVPEANVVGNKSSQLMHYSALTPIPERVNQTNVNDSKHSLQQLGGHQNNQNSNSIVNFSINSLQNLDDLDKRQSTQPLSTNATAANVPTSMTALPTQQSENMFVPDQRKASANSTSIPGNTLEKYYTMEYGQIKGIPIGTVIQAIQTDVRQREPSSMHRSLEEQGINHNSNSRRSLNSMRQSLPNLDTINGSSGNSQLRQTAQRVILNRQSYPQNNQQSPIPRSSLPLERQASGPRLQGGTAPRRIPERSPPAHQQYGQQEFHTIASTKNSKEQRELSLLPLESKQSPSSSKLFKPTQQPGFSLKQLNLKEAERNSKQDDILEYYRKLEDKDAEINNLTVRLHLREGYADAADKTQQTLRIESKRWEDNYHRLDAEFKAYKLRIEEQSLSVPMMQKQNESLKDRLRDLERDVALKEVENRVLTNRLKIVSEDYTTLKLVQMSLGTSDEKNTTRKRGGFFSNNSDQVELITENQKLKDLLRKQESQHLKDQTNWKQEEGYLKDRDGQTQQMKELGAQLVTQQQENKRLKTDREKAETAFKKRISDLSAENKILLREQAQAEMVIKQRNGSMQKELQNLKGEWMKELIKLQNDNAQLQAQIADSKVMLKESNSVLQKQQSKIREEQGKYDNLVTKIVARNSPRQPVQQSDPAANQAGQSSLNPYIQQLSQQVQQKQIALLDQDQRNRNPNQQHTVSQLFGPRQQQNIRFTVIDSAP